MDDEGIISADGKVLRPKQVELQEKRKKLIEEHKRESAERNLRNGWFVPMFEKLRLKIDEIIELEEDLLSVQLSRIEIRRRTSLLMKQKAADVDQENRGIIPLHSKPMRSILKSIENSPNKLKNRVNF